MASTERAFEEEIEVMKQALKAKEKELERIKKELEALDAAKAARPK